MKNQKKQRKCFFNHTALHAQKLKKSLIESHQRVISSGRFFEGEENRKLAKTLSQMIGMKYVTLVGSGHDALMIALSALQLTPNDEIIIPANAYPTAFPAFLSGAKVVLCDVDENGQLSFDELKKVISLQTRAVIMVHLYGLVGEIGKIKKLLHDQKIIFIEDCAQAFGTRFQGKSVGSFGDMSCFSFYPTKNLGTLGDGGAIVTNQKKFAEYFQQAKKYGEIERYHSQFISSHSRLPELQAACLNVYLKNFAKTVLAKKKLEKYFVKKIQEKYLAPYLRVAESHPDSIALPHLFVIETEQRDRLKKNLEKQGIKTQIHYPLPVHKVVAFQKNLEKITMGETKTFPMSEKLAEKILSLPFHQYMQKSEIDKIVESLQKFSAARYEPIKSLSLFFPAYNDALSIGDLVKKADETAQKITSDYEILVINDGSRDNTAVVLKKLQQKFKKLRVITHPQNRGYGGALISGFTHATKDWVFYTDGDGQYDPGELLKLVGQLTPGIDVVNGRRSKREDPWDRQLLGQIYNAGLHFLYHIPISDLDCDFRLIRRKKLQQISFSANSGLICLELIRNLTESGAKFRETVTNHYSRQHGHSQFYQLSHLKQTLQEHLHFFIDQKLLKTLRNKIAATKKRQTHHEKTERKHQVNYLG